MFPPEKSCAPYRSGHVYKLVSCNFVKGIESTDSVEKFKNVGTSSKGIGAPIGTRNSSLDTVKKKIRSDL